MGVRKTNEEFLKKISFIHDIEFYDYLSEYYDADEKILIQCRWCGNIFMQTPHNHSKGQGCPFCGKYILKN